MRPGGEYFGSPTHPVHRRCEATRAYLYEARPAEEVAERFGYTPATVYQMAAQVRAGEAAFFLSSKPGPKGARKQPGIRQRVLELRAADRSVIEIAAAITAEGTPVSHQTVFKTGVPARAGRRVRFPSASALTRV